MDTYFNNVIKQDIIADRMLCNLIIKIMRDVVYPQRYAVLMSLHEKTYKGFHKNPSRSFYRFL